MIIQKKIIINSKHAKSFNKEICELPGNINMYSISDQFRWVGVGGVL